MSKPRGRKPGGEASNEPPARLIELLRANVTSFPSISEAGDALSRTFDSFGTENNTKVLLIGDASHGTSEFYAARAELTKYMIQHHGFNIVAVEADWPDAEAVDRYVRRRGPGPGAAAKEASIEPEAEARRQGRQPAFMRFPTWMWRNREVKEFVEWLREWNTTTQAGKEGVGGTSTSSSKDSVGFYGLDLYSMGASMRAVIDYLDSVDPGGKMADLARERYGGLMTWAEHPHEYGLGALASDGFRANEAAVLAMLRDLLARRLEYSARRGDGDEFHGAEQNARLVRDAERYYKAMYYAHDESWNLRDTHMFETLVRVLKHRGPGSRAVVWAHNSHVGDAQATSMGWAAGELNLGQLCREAYGDRALVVGCGTYDGTVAAADRWDDDMRVMGVRPALPGSYEEVMHAVGVANFALDLRRGRCDPELRALLARRRLERFIGVVYRPATELQSHYSSAVLPDQFDGFVWFDRTSHVGALEVHQPHEGATEFDETWPFGV